MILMTSFPLAYYHHVMNTKLSSYVIVFYNTNCGLVVRGKNLHFIDASPSCLKLSLLFNFNTCLSVCIVACIHNMNMIELNFDGFLSNCHLLALLLYWSLFVNNCDKFEMMTELSASPIFMCLDFVF